MTERKRCSWCEGSKLMMDYHDKEWGKPVHDDDILFEFLILECMQAGLSWETILKKRENYRMALHNFNYKKISEYTHDDEIRLLSNPGIIRNMLKVKAIINNAQRFMEVQKEFHSFDNYIWSFTNHDVIQNKFKNLAQLPATTEISDTMSKDMKKRGFKFVGSTICYAFMQAVGMVNDHFTNCFRYEQLK
jgi:DNA-3-methyladenine glycosylase I